MSDQVEENAEQARFAAFVETTLPDERDCIAFREFEVAIIKATECASMIDPYDGGLDGDVRWTRAIGPRLKAWRRARGFGQLTAARRIGICLETVTKLERGRLETAALEARGRVFDAVSPSASLSRQAGTTFVTTLPKPLRNAASATVPAKCPPNR